MSMVDYRERVGVVGYRCLPWVDLPGIARYAQQFAFYAPDRRITLELRSPLLRSMPGGEPETTHAWESEEVVSFDEAFKRELVEFSACIVSNREARTSGRDWLGDVSVCEALARAHLTSNPDPGHPRRVPAGGSGRQA